MTTEQTTGRPHPCPREGCPGMTSAVGQNCSYLCRAIAQELENTQRTCEYIGDTPLTTELWTEAVALSDACSRYLELGYQLRIKAMEVGISPKQWQEIRKGRAGR